MIYLVVACANANSIHRYGWTAGMESVFRLESQVLTSIPEIKQSQMAGLKIMANVRVQALQDYTLRVKIENAQLVTLNGEIDLTDANRSVENGGANSDLVVPGEIAPCSSSSALAARKGCSRSS